MYMTLGSVWKMACVPLPAAAAAIGAGGGGSPYMPLGWVWTLAPAGVPLPAHGMARDMHAQVASRQLSSPHAHKPAGEQPTRPQAGSPP